MVSQGRFGARILLLLVSGAVVFWTTSQAASQTQKGAPTEPAARAADRGVEPKPKEANAEPTKNADERARANVEAATVKLNEDKECLTEDPKFEVERQANHRASAYILMTAEMIEDAHTQCDEHWDTVETSHFKAMDSRVARLLTWPGILTSPAHAQVTALKDNPLGADFIPQSFCQDAASAKPALCERVIHPAVRPFCLAWVKIRKGAAADPSICADFAPAQQKACKLFFGVDAGACKTAEGAEVMWCSFIQGVKSGGLPRCGENFQADGCIRDILMLSTLEKDRPCAAIREHNERSGRPAWSRQLLDTQCKAITEGKPDDCPRDPAEDYERSLKFQPQALSQAVLRGGGAGVMPVVGVIPWMPVSASSNRPGAASVGTTELQVFCANEVTARTLAGGTERQFVASSGSLKKIHKARGEAFKEVVDPFDGAVETHTTCALTAPWIGLEGR